MHEEMSGQLRALLEVLHMVLIATFPLAEAGPSQLVDMIGFDMVVKRFRRFELV
jgi:hypothetical protein